MPYDINARVKAARDNIPVMATTTRAFVDDLIHRIDSGHVNVRVEIESVVDTMVALEVELRELQARHNEG